MMELLLTGLAALLERFGALLLLLAATWVASSVGAPRPLLYILGGSAGLVAVAGEVTRIIAERRYP